MFIPFFAIFKLKSAPIDHSYPHYTKYICTGDPLQNMWSKFTRKKTQQNKQTKQLGSVKIYNGLSHLLSEWSILISGREYVCVLVHADARARTHTHTERERERERGILLLMNNWHIAESIYKYACIKINGFVFPFTLSASLKNLN